MRVMRNIDEETDGTKTGRPPAEFMKGKKN